MVRVQHPVFPSASVRSLGPLSTARFTQAGFEWAVRRAVGGCDRSPDVVYGHFLYQAGRAAVRLGATLGRPSFVAVGEGTFWTVDPVGFQQARKDFRTATGFVAVSTPIRNGLIERLGIPAEKIGVFPNGVDLELFRRRNGADARARFGLTQNDKVVVFVGAFDELKGGERLVEAARGIPGLRLLLVGSGEKRLASAEVAFCGPLSHEEVPIALSAADVFALPTMEEGSCNAVIEAMACGLPVVTSDGDYMDDLVDDAVAIRLDPTDVAGLRAALLDLLQDEARRKAMSEAAISRASGFGLRDRAERVLAWMQKRMENSTG